jgi:uroporphyrinogen decarboxylase
MSANLRNDALGWPLIFHCGGDLQELLPLLIEDGISCIQPTEARYGNDVREYKEIYGGRVCFFGNIGYDVLATNDRELIEEEVRSKVLIAKEGGGYIGHSDDSIPPTVSWDSYRWFIGCMKKYGSYD